MTLQNLIFRQQIIDSTRNFFKKKHYQEIDPPTLSTSLPLEQNLYSFKTIWEHNKANLYMSVSPEMYLKKCLRAGIGNCFTISKCFRDLESTGIYHNYEFTMLEWYTQASNYHQTANLTEKYINTISVGMGNKKIKRVNYKLKSLFKIYANLNLDEYLTSPGFNEPDFNQLFLNKIEPHIPANFLVFIFDYPTALSPLASPIIGTPYSERFEVYLSGVEIGNGNTENTNSDSIRKFMQVEHEYRQKHSLPTHPIDYDFIKACGQLPPCSGIGIGIDRLTMILSNTSTIADLFSL